jgi:hypothetical protein
MNAASCHFSTALFTEAMGGDSVALESSRTIVL